MANNSTTKDVHDGSEDAHGPKNLEQETDQGRSDIGDFTNTITVLVGRKEERFILHQDAVCARPKFFKAACSKQWREGRERLIRLPEGSPVVFKAYCDWVYKGELAEPTCAPESNFSDQTAKQEHFIDLFLLGDSLDDTQLRNWAISMLFESMRRQALLPNAASFSKIWNSTTPGSQLRKMMVHVIVTRFKRDIFVEKISLYPQELVQQVAVALMMATPTVA